MKHYGLQSGIYDLNQGWRFTEKDFSILPERREHNDVYNYSKAGGVKGPAQSSFDDSDWEEISLPHDWVVKHDFDKREMLNHGYKARGKGWYRNKFRLLEEDKNRQIVLEFEGMSSEALIFFNGQLVYRNFSGYQGFSIDMTDMANFGEVPNILAVRIDVSAWEGWWYEGAGIYRPVWLIKKPPVHIAYQGQWIQTVYRQDGFWNVDVETELENSFESEQELQLTVEIQNGQGQVVAAQTISTKAEGFERKKITISFNVEQPMLWSPEMPALYRCRTCVNSNGEMDFQVTEFGFRRIKIDAENGFWLNGVNRKLKGFCNHQDHAGVGVAVPYAVKEYRIKCLKEIGADAYRCAHNTDPEILEICDRMGMMVMEENRNFSTAEENLRCLDRLVKNSRNHPCVIFYSVFNEEPLQGTGKGQRMAQRMRARIRQLDSERPVLGAFNGGYMEEFGAAGALDIVGINYNQKMYDSFHRKYPSIPMIASETSSAYSVRGEYKTDREKHIFGSYDVDYAAWGESARKTWKLVQERPFVAGNFCWTGFDYRGEPTPYDWPSISSYFGVLDSCGFRKTSSYLYEGFYKSTPMVHIEPHWTWNIALGTPVKVYVISNCEEIRVFLNGKFVCTDRKMPFEMLCFEIPYEPGTLRAEGSIAGKTVCADEVITAGKPHKLLLKGSVNELKADGLDAAVINVCVTDAKGIPVPDADNLITFEVVGNGKIIGVGNGNPNSHESDYASERKAFHALAQVIVKNFGKEDVLIRAKSQSLETAELLIRTSSNHVLPKVPAVSWLQIDGWKLYYKLFDKMPDANPILEKNDMNSFEPVSFEGKPQTQLAENFGKYALYRAECDLTAYPIGTVLYFGGILGSAWVYVDGNLEGVKENFRESHLSVHLKKKYRRGVVTVIIQNTDVEWQQAGILQPVFLQRI